jgi:formylglycine-generating enzyme required for sulfatase activity
MLQTPDPTPEGRPDSSPDTARDSKPDATLASVTAHRSLSVAAMAGGVVMLIAIKMLSSASPAAWRPQPAPLLARVSAAQPEPKPNAKPEPEAKIESQSQPKPAGPSEELMPFVETIAGTTVTIAMTPIPAGRVRVPDAEKPGEFKDIKVGPLWMSTTEVQWPAVDVYVFKLDADGPISEEADAVTRPSKPYIPPDRGYGHEGYAAISMTVQSARGFAQWLSAKTGKTYRLATEAEWEHACRAGAESASAYGLGEGGVEITAESLGDFAWHKGNSGGTPHAAGSKKPNTWGLFDIHGNVGEWVEGTDGTPVLKGGTYRDEPAALEISDRAAQTRAWNQTDPNMPKSKWWLSDGPFAGFRLVCEGPSDGAATSNPAPMK